MKRQHILIAVLVAVVCLAVGIGIGFGIGKGKYDTASDDGGGVQPTSKPVTREQREKERIARHKSIIDGLNNGNIEENLKYLTEYPHTPGSARSKALGDEIERRWKEQGLDRVDKFKYNVYLPFPKTPGTISALKSDGSVAEKLTIDTEPAFDDSEKKGNVVYPFNAFGMSGVVTAPVVYCNYGRDADFAQLDKRNISIAGKIALFRYGKTARAFKVYRTELRKGLAAIIYSDPYDNVYPGQEYPNGFMGNKVAIQRGTLNRINGDALSVGWPSKDGYYRLKEAKYKSEINNPSIPSQPISQAEAEVIFKHFIDDSVAVPTSFVGGLPRYVLQSGVNFTVKTDIEFKTYESYTICGTVFGKTEPDRYVMMGNHRDAWTYGASDASSGTAAIMEIARTLSQHVKQNWRPQRSVMICSWGSEETGIQGSYEWAYEHKDFLMNNVILYVNVDMAVEGNFTIRLRSLDYYSKAVEEAAKYVQAPDDNEKTLYKDWLEKSALLLKKPLNEVKRPKHDMISSGSDYKALWHVYGVPSGDFRYYFSRLDYPLVPQNPQYHTRYDSFGWMKQWVDPEFKYHQAIARLMLSTALMASDKSIISLDLRLFVDEVKKYLLLFEKAYQYLLKPRAISLDFAKSRLEALSKKAIKFHHDIDNMKRELSDYEIRMINDKIIHFEKNFLLPNLIRREGANHVVFAPSFFKLSNTKFPGMNEAIYDASNDPSSDWDEVRKQTTLLVWCFDSANLSLDLQLAQ